MSLIELPWGRIERPDPPQYHGPMYQSGPDCDVQALMAIAWQQGAEAGAALSPDETTKSKVKYLHNPYEKDNQ